MDYLPVNFDIDRLELFKFPDSLSQFYQVLLHLLFRHEHQYALIVLLADSVKEVCGPVRELHLVLEKGGNLLGEIILEVLTKLMNAGHFQPVYVSRYNFEEFFIYDSNRCVLYVRSELLDENIVVKQRPDVVNQSHSANNDLSGH